MKITPERALELATEDEAEALRYRAIERRHLDLADQLHARDFACYAEMHEGRAAILRAYAEIAPKWQAVLDAEPKSEAFQQAAMLIADHFDYPWQYMPEQGRADLLGLAKKVAVIIKPAP